MIYDVQAMFILCFYDVHLMFLWCFFLWCQNLF